jgi:hypothetical protein
VTDPWAILQRGGLPLGMPERDAEHPTELELAAAVEAAITGCPKGRPRDALSALVLAWRRQWPRTFSRAFGVRAAEVGRWAQANVTDPNRHLKLSRIAMANLATVL